MQLIEFAGTDDESVWLNPANVTSVGPSGGATAVHLGSDLQFLRGTPQEVVECLTRRAPGNELEELRAVCRRFLQANAALSDGVTSEVLEAREDDAIESMRRLVPGPSTIDVADLNAVTSPADAATVARWPTV